MNKEQVRMWAIQQAHQTMAAWTGAEEIIKFATKLEEYVLKENEEHTQA